MLCSTPTWITYANDAVLCVSVILVIVLMQKAEHDKSINRIDSKSLRIARRVSFITIAASVVIVLLSDFNPLALLLMFSATMSILMVDIIALNHRPPATGLKAASLGWSPARHIASIFRRGN